MDKTTLVTSDLQSGLEAVRTLHAAGLPIAIAAWLKLRENEVWKLYVASPDVEKHGPTSVNRFVADLFEKLKLSFPLSDIVVVNPRNSFVGSLSADHIANWPLPRRITDGGLLQIGSFTLGNVEVAAAIVYKVSPTVKASRLPLRASGEVLEKAKKLAA